MSSVDCCDPSPSALDRIDNIVSSVDSLLLDFFSHVVAWGGGRMLNLGGSLLHLLLLLLIGYISVVKLLDHFEIQFPHLEDWNNNCPYSIGW